MNSMRQLAGIILSALTLNAQAQTTTSNFPARPLRIIVGYAPGGGADITARVIGQKMSEDLGQPIVIENRVGASGAIAVAAVAKASADGYFLLMMTAGELVQPALRNNLPYDVQADLAPVALVGISPFVLVVHPSVSANNVAELVMLAKAQPGKLNFASSGIGTSPHLAGELFAQLSNTTITHIPYKGGAQAAAATLSGEVQLSFPATTSALPLIQAGKLRPLAVTTARRTSFLPTVPTVEETGLGKFDRSSWYGLMAPAGTPKAVIARLNDAVKKALNTPEVKRSFQEQGIDAAGNSPEQFASFIRSELEVNAAIVKSARIKAE